MKVAELIAVLSRLDQGATVVMVDSEYGEDPDLELTCGADGIVRIDVAPGTPPEKGPAWYAVRLVSSGEGLWIPDMDKPGISPEAVSKHPQPLVGKDHRKRFDTVEAAEAAIAFRCERFAEKVDDFAVVPSWI